MTLITHDPTARERFPSAIDRMVTNQQAIIATGDPIARSNDPDPLTWRESWRVGVGLSMRQAVVNFFNRPSASLQTVDWEFDPYEYIRKHDKLKNDPDVQFMLDRGQFDSSMNLEQFLFDYHAGKAYMKDLKDVQRRTYLQFAAFTLAEIGGDPANLIPGAIALKGAKSASTAAHVAKTAATFAAFGVGAEKAYNALQPISDDPGLTNELIAGGFSAALGAIIGTATSPATKGAASRYLSSRKVRQLRRATDRMLNEKVVQNDTGDFSLTIQEALDQGKDELLTALNEPVPTEGRTITALHVDGDENHGLIQQLRQKYADADAPLRIVDHPEQEFYTTLKIAQDVLGQVSGNIDATAADLDYGMLSAATTAASKRYTKLMQDVGGMGITPGARLANNTIGRITDVYRTLSGSAQTVTRNNARGIASGPAAESIRGLVERSADEANIAVRRTFKAAKRKGTIVYDGTDISSGISGLKRFREAVTDYRRRLHAQHRGYDVPMPDDVPDSVKEASDHLTRMLRATARDLEEEGMMEIGPRALADANHQVTRVQRDVYNIESAIDRAQQQAGEADLVPVDYTINSVRQRLNQEAQAGGDLLTLMQQQIDQYQAANPNINLEDDLVQGTSGFPISDERWADIDPNVRRRMNSNPDGFVPYASEERASELQEILGPLYDQIEDYLYSYGQGADPTSTYARQMLYRADGAADPAVVFDAWFYDAWQNVSNDVKRRGRVMVNAADMPNNRVFRILDQEAIIRPIDGRRVLELDGARIDVEALPRFIVDRESLAGLDVPIESAAPRAKTRLERLQIRRQELISREAAAKDRVTKIHRAVQEMDYYTPRIFDVQKIRSDEQGFVGALARSFRESDNIVNGTRVGDDARPVLAEVMDNMPSRYRDDVADAVGKTRNETVGQPATAAQPPTPDTAPFRIPFREASRPRMGSKVLRFESDFDKALYIVSNSRGRRSKRDADFMRALMEYTGLSESELRRMGDQVSTRIRSQVSDINTQGTHTVRAGASGFTLSKATGRQVRQLPLTVSELVDGLTEADLPDHVLTAYRAELDAYYQRNANKVFRLFTESQDDYGPVEALPAPDPIKRRIMDINEADLSRYMAQDSEEILNRYVRTIGGRMAIRRAIRLNPETWADAKLRDGTSVQTGEHLMAYLNEAVSAVRRVADRAAAKDKKAQSLVTAAERMQKRVDRDILKPIQMLEGRKPVESQSGVFAGWASAGRSMIRLSYLNKLGSVLWAQINDVAPVTLYMMQRPETIFNLRKMTLAMANASRRDLEITGLWADNMRRVHNLAELDPEGVRGFGTGVFKKASGAAEGGLEAAGDVQARISGLNWFTNSAKRLAGMLVMDRVNDHARRLARALDLIDGGMERNAALRKAGLNSYDAARLSHLGIGDQDVRQYLDLIYRYGTDIDGNRIHRTMTREQFLQGKQIVLPNFEAWNYADDSIRNLYQRFTANVGAEVHRHLIVTPGVFDRPLINMTMFGRMFNQFQTFGMAFVNQRLRVMAQMPAKYQLWYSMAYLGLGAISDAITNQLSGRRNFKETAELWQTNPLGMAYASFERSGLTGWLGRPMAIAQAMQMPWTPDKIMDNTGSPAARHIQPGKELTYAGPVAGDISRISHVAFDLMAGDVNESTAYNAWKTVPFQNLLWLRMLSQLTGAPLTPESLMRERWKDQEPQP